MENVKDGFHVYRVKFTYRGSEYSTEFCSTAEIKPDTEPLVAWGLADDAIKSVMATIDNRQKGVYPHGIVISGEFGSLTVKE